MQDSHQQALQNYIQQRLAAGATKEVIRQELLGSGWLAEIVDAGLSSTAAPVPAPKPVRDPKQIRNGILWILSPFIVLTGTALLQLLARLANIDSVGIKILSLLAGLAGVILIFAGPIIGIVKLSKSK